MGAIKLFYCYAPEDKPLRDQLEKHLANMRWQGLITTWHDQDISAGKEWEREVNNQLETANIILLLISSDFMFSEYCYDVLMKLALKRHRDRKARVIPIILRSVDWQDAPFSNLQMLPTNATPVKSWVDPDDAFLDIVKS